MRIVCSVSVLVLVCAGGAWAQAVAGFGAVTGTVLENTVDGIPDATVVVSNEPLGIRWTMLTSDDGVFFAPALVPAAGYRFKVTRMGFADWESSEFQVFLGRTLNFKVDLVKGEGSATKGRAAAPKGGGTAPQTATPAPTAPAQAPGHRSHNQSTSRQRPAVGQRQQDRRQQSHHHLADRRAAVGRSPPGSPGAAGADCSTPGTPPGRSPT